MRLEQRLLAVGPAVRQCLPPQHYPPQQVYKRGKRLPALVKPFLKRGVPRGQKHLPDGVSPHLERLEQQRKLDSLKVPLLAAERGEEVHPRHEEAL